MSDNDKLEIVEEEDIPDDAMVLLCGVVVGDEGIIGRLPEVDQSELQGEGGD